MQQTQHTLYKIRTFNLFITTQANPRATTSDSIPIATQSHRGSVSIRSNFQSSILAAQNAFDSIRAAALSQLSSIVSSKRRGYTGSGRFYISPMARRHQNAGNNNNQVTQRQLFQQLKRPEGERRGMALSLRQSTLPAEMTNLDRLMEAFTPFIQARFRKEVNVEGHITAVSQEESQAYFYLDDLWESFKEWSAYGAGVPFLLNGKHSIRQYYVPFLSGIQLYPDPSSHLLLNCSGGRPGFPYFDFMEHEAPYIRRPLSEKMTLFASSNPELGKLRSCDLLPTSWFSVAWYPIYRIPVGPMLQDLEASFLTFHSLSTQSNNSCPAVYHEANTRTIRGVADKTARISLPVFGLASYKLKGSPLDPRGAYECEQENSLLVAAENWLRFSQVTLPDYQFFCGRNANRQR